LILRGIKTIELRGWVPSEKTIKPGERFIIHAPKKVDIKKCIEEGLDWQKLDKECFVGDVAYDGTKVYGSFPRKGLGVYNAAEFKKDRDKHRVKSQVTRNKANGLLLSNPRRFDPPISGKGKLQFFDFPLDLDLELYYVGIETDGAKKAKRPTKENIDAVRDYQNMNYPH
jgi:hypothetical protein